jgi:ketosteroid isomerase-like protein
VSDPESVLRRSFEAWNADDWEALEALWEPSGAIVAPEGWPETGEIAGWPAIRSQFERIKGPWTEERVEEASLERVGDRLLAEVRWTTRGEASGVPLEVRMWMLCSFSDGTFTRIEYFLDERSAQEAAGVDA